MLCIWFNMHVWQLDLVLDLVLVVLANPLEDSSVRIDCSAKIPTQLKPRFLTHPCKYIPLRHSTLVGLLWYAVSSNRKVDV